jgi:hypothetical protein
VAQRGLLTELSWQLLIARNGLPGRGITPCVNGIIATRIKAASLRIRLYRTTGAFPDLRDSYDSWLKMDFHGQ